MIAVISAVRGQVERDRDTLAAGSKGFAIKRIGGLCCTKPGILTDGPGAARIHGGFDAANIRGKTGQAVFEGNVLHVFCGVKLL